MAFRKGVLVLPLNILCAFSMFFLILHSNMATEEMTKKMTGGHMTVSSAKEPFGKFISCLSCWLKNTHHLGLT